MRRTILLFYFLFMVFLLSNFKMKGIAQEDLYSFPKIEEENTKKIVEKKSLDPFIETLVKKFSSDEKLLSESVSKGFGRRELIRLILMAKKSGKSLEELIKEIEKNLEKRIKEKPPSPPTAGIAEQLDKKGASYSLLNSTGSIESEKKDERK